MTSNLNQQNTCTTSEQTVASLERPTVSKELAINLSEKFYGINVLEAKEFKSYGDRNFYIRTTKSNNGNVEDQGNNEFILKILNYTDSAIEGMVEAQNGAMLFLKDKGLRCPIPVLSSSGSYINYCDCRKFESTLEKECKARRARADANKLSAVRLMRYVPGDLLQDVSELTPNLLIDLGQYVGKLDKLLKEYNHPKMNDKLFYGFDLVQLKELKPYILAKYLGSTERETLILNVYRQYISIVPQVLQKYKKQVLHFDINEANIIVKKDLNNMADKEWSVAGVIDFGDMCYSFRVFEIAITMAHIMSFDFSRGNPRAFESVGKILQGYQSVYPLSTEELDILYWCIAGRFIQVLIMGSYKQFIEHENEYVLGINVNFWDIIPQYLKFTSRELLDKWMTDKLY